MKKMLSILSVGLILIGCGLREPKEDVKSSAPEVTNDNIAKGMELLKQSDVVGAIRQFDEAIRKDPRNAQNYLVLGQVYLHLKQYPQAVDTFQAATRIDPNNGESFYLLAMSKQLQGENKQEAVAAAQKSVELFQANRDEANFKKALILLKSISEADKVQTPPSAIQ